MWGNIGNTAVLNFVRVVVEFYMHTYNIAHFLVL